MIDPSIVENKEWMGEVEHWVEVVVLGGVMLK